MAAERTPGVRRQPAPVVLQTALGDFAVEYKVPVCIDQPHRRIVTLNALHANIQDAFNEYGVQTTSPAYESDPSERKTVPPSQWYAAPAPVPAESAASDVAFPLAVPQGLGRSADVLSRRLTRTAVALIRPFVTCGRPAAGANDAAAGRDRDRQRSHVTCLLQRPAGVLQRRREPQATPHRTLRHRVLAEASSCGSKCPSSAPAMASGPRRGWETHTVSSSSCPTRPGDSRWLSATASSSRLPSTHGSAAANGCRPVTAPLWR